MPLQEEPIVEEQLADLKIKYLGINTDAALDWERPERHAKRTARHHFVEPVSKLSVNRVGSACRASAPTLWAASSFGANAAPARSGQTGQVCPLPHRRGLASKMASRAATGSFEIGSIVKLLKIAACLMLISGFLAALTVAFLMKDFHPPIKQRVNSIAFSGLKTPSLTIPPSMSGPGGLSAASSFMNNQNVNVILDFNKMPAFSMPKMPAKVCEGRR